MTEPNIDQTKVREAEKVVELVDILLKREGLDTKCRNHVPDQIVAGYARKNPQWI